MHEIMATRLALERRAAATPLGRLRTLLDAHPFRDYLEAFLPIYLRSTDDTCRSLVDLLNSMTDDPQTKVVFIAQLAASEVASEMYHFAGGSVREARGTSEADDQGATGKQITDSIKKFIVDLLSGGWIRSKIFKKENVEKALHVPNEIISMFFPGVAR